MIDARGHRLTLAGPPRRILSLVPSLTELLAHLGLDDEVVGRTRFCVHPAEWKIRKPIVGGTKQVNLNCIEALRPDLILANLEENTQEMVEALDRLAPTYVTDVGTVPEALDMIRTVGRLTDRAADADSLAAGIGTAFAALPVLRRIHAAYLIWHDPYMTVGHDTFIHDVMTRAGFVNVFGHRARYPEVTPDELVAAQPEVLLLSSEPFPFREKHFGAFRVFLPGVPIRLVDGALFSWYGHRLLQTPDYLRHLRADLDGVIRHRA